MPEPSTKNLAINLAATELGLGGQLEEQLTLEEKDAKKKREPGIDTTDSLLNLASSVLGL